MVLTRDDDPKGNVLYLIGLSFTDFTKAGKRKSPYLGLSSIKVGEKITNTNFIDTDVNDKSPNAHVACFCGLAEGVKRKILSTALAYFSFEIHISPFIV